MKKNLKFKLVNTLSDALIIRRIRNECRLYLTNHMEHISMLRQIYWYFNDYRKMLQSKKYRLFILRTIDNTPVAYGALSLHNEYLYITECVKSEYRRQGYGSAILKNLIAIAQHEKRQLAAEIWATNTISILFHKKFGFTLQKTVIKSGSHLCTYRRKNLYGQHNARKT